MTDDRREDRREATEHMSTETDGDRDYYPMLDASDEELAHELTEWKQAVREAVNEADRALLNDDVELEDQHAEAIEDAGVALRGLSNTLRLMAEK